MDVEEVVLLSNCEEEEYDYLSYDELEDCIYDLDIKRFTNETFELAERIFLEDVKHIRGYNDLVGLNHFQDLWDNLDCVKDTMEGDFEPFIDLLEYYTKQSKAKSKENKKDKLQNTNLEQIDYGIKNNNVVIKSLEYALAKVDTSRCNKEIVKYINKLWTTQYIKSRERNYKDIDIDVWIFGKTTSVLGDLMKELFQCRQLRFIKKVETILNDYEIKKRLGNGSELIVPNKREVARIMDMSESNFKHRLARIRNKVLDNWEELAQKRLEDMQKTSHF